MTGGNRADGVERWSPNGWGLGRAYDQQSYSRYHAEEREKGENGQTARETNKVLRESKHNVDMELNLERVLQYL